MNAAIQIPSISRYVGRFAALSCILICDRPLLFSQDQAFEPIMRVDAHGHSSRVMTLCFNSTGNELWTAGWDKTVRLWKITDDGRWVPQLEQTIYLPLGPGRNGAIDNIALSADDRWLAVGGYSRITAANRFNEGGFFRDLSTEQLLDQGTIYVYDRHTRKIRKLTGNRGPVRRLLFDRQMESPRLASAGFDIQIESGKLVNRGSLRLWDIQGSRQTAQLTLPAPVDPSLAFLEGDSPNTVRLATNWGDGKVYVWDTKVSTPVTAGQGSQMLVRSNHGTWVATAGVEAGRAGQISFWSTVSNNTLSLQSSRKSILPSENVAGSPRHFLPLSGLAFTYGPNKKEYLAVAMLIWKNDATNGPNQAIGYQLRVYEVPSTQQPIREVSRHDLWTASGDSGLGMPSLAASEAGSVLAVANGSDEEIRVFQLNELTRGRSNPVLLSNRLLPLQKANFVIQSKTTSPGIGLRLQSGQEPPIVLDITGNQIVTSSTVSQWQNFDATVTGWEVQGNNANGRFVVRNGQRLKLALPNDTQYLMSAFVPGNQTNPEPALVVAGEEQGQPWLGVISPSSGELIRVLTGHTNRILHLSVSRDGRFVSSTSADRTVALWDLSQQDRLASRHATLQNVALASSADGIIVERAPADSGLLPNDKLLGIVDNQSLSPWSKAEQAFRDVAVRKPGSQVSLKVQRGAERRDVKVTLRRAVEDQKPLGQLMLIRAAKEPQWVAWSPMGYYDVSSLDVRSNLGWLFNPGDTADPANYSGIEQYPKLYVPGLLNELWQRPDQDLNKISLRDSVATFELAIAKPQATQRALDGNSVVDAQPHDVYLTLTNEFPREFLKTPDLFLDGRLLGPMVDSGQQGWNAPNNAFDKLSPGVHRISAKIAGARVGQVFETELTFHFIPPPPKIALANKIDKHSKELSHRFQASIDVGIPGLPVDVKLEKLDDVEHAQLVKQWKANEPPAIDLALPLDIGVNRFRLRALYEIECPKELERMSELHFQIERHPLDGSPPAFEALSLRPADESLPGLTPLEDLSTPINSPYPNLVLLGRVSAKELLADVKLGSETLAGFTSRSATSIDFKSAISLKPGMNRITLAASTIAKSTAQEEMVVHYRPKLPKAEIAFPPPDYEIVETLATPELKLTVDVRATRFSQASQVDIALNGRQLATEKVAGVKDQTLEILLPIQVGRNASQVHIKGDMDGQTETLAVNFYYHPTPVLQSVHVPETTREPAFQLIARGRAADAIERILLDDQEIPAMSWRSSYDNGSFTLEFKAATASETMTKRRLTVFSRGIPKAASSDFVQPKNLGPIKPPKVSWNLPAAGSAVTASQMKVQFEVQSSEPLTRLLLNGESLSPESGVRISSDTLAFEHLVRFEPGMNELRVTTENAGGLGTREITVQRLLPPGYVESVYLTDARNKTVRPKSNGDSLWTFEGPLESGRDLVLNFTVIAEKACDTWVTVNGFRRRVVADAANSKVERIHYQCPVVLSKSRENLIEILPDLPKAQSSRTRLQVDCLSPVKPKQRLHLALVGIGVTDEQEFIANAVKAITGSPYVKVDGRLYKFTSPAFDQCFAYGPYVGPEVNRGLIHYLLTNEIPNNISRQANDPLIQDVVLFYYRGGEQVFHGGEFYLTTHSQNPSIDAIMRNPRWLQNKGISSSYLSKVLNDLQGAHVMMLDVARLNGEGSRIEPVISSFAPHAATFRFAWTGRNIVPNEARLMTAWTEAFPRALNLSEIERELALEHAEASSRFGGAIRYEYNTPDLLREVVLRQ